MERDLEKMFLTKDAKQRVKIYRDNEAENPRYMTDEPLHFEDWHRDYSLMSKSERESKSNDARSLIECFLEKYGKHKEIIDLLVDCGKHMDDGQHVIDDALVYDKSMHMWVLKCYRSYYDNEQGKRLLGWRDDYEFECKKQDIDISYLLECLQDETIDYLVEHGYMRDKVKAASYEFDYYNGGVKFYPEISCESEGICWMEHDELMKYSGCKEEYWKGKSLRDIEYLLDEIEAWGDNEVYGFVVEKRVKKIVNTRYPDGEHDDTEKEIVSWEETDSCRGFYGELSKNLEYMLSDAGFKLQDLDEVNC